MGVITKDEEEELVKEYKLRMYQRLSGAILKEQQKDYQLKVRQNYLKALNNIKAELNKPENKGKGIGEIFEALTKDKADIFRNPNQVQNMAGFGGTDINAVDDAKVRRIMGLPVKE